MKRSLSTTDQPTDQSIDQQYNSFSVYKGTRSNIMEPDLSPPLEAMKKDVLWVSATKIYNAMLSNHLVDWLERYGKNILHSFPPTSPQFMQFLCKRGIDFEAMIVKNLQQHHKTVKVANYYSLNAVEHTLQYMKDGVPIICSAPLANPSKSTYGIADLLVRSDMFGSIFKHNPISDDDANIPAPKLGTPFHYRVIEVKYCTLPLTSDGRHIANIPKFLSYKGQLHIYNECLGKLQGYTPPETYILGRKTSASKLQPPGEQVSAFDRLGVVNYTLHDKDIVKLTSNAIKWYRKVQQKGARWSIDPPSRPELYPNMSVDSGKWDPVKLDIAVKLRDVSLLWNCGASHRQIASQQGITQFDKCSGTILGFKHETAHNIDNIIYANSPTHRHNVWPQSIPVTPNLWESDISKRPKEFYVDFETFTDICNDIGESPVHKDFNMIFMIGVGWSANGTWHHQHFIADSIAHDAEFALMKRFQSFIRQAADAGEPPVLFFWHADEMFWKHALNRHQDRIDPSVDPVSTMTTWHNLMNTFIKLKVAVRGCYDYKLKHLGAAMKQHNMITTQLEADCSNGAMAMIRAWQCYDKYQVPSTAPIMKDVARYNHYDCKIMYDMLRYLRRNVFVIESPPGESPATFPNNISIK